MKLYQRSKRAGYLKIKTDEDFRDDVVVVSKRHNGLFLNGTYLNPFVYFEVITKQLSTGDHKFRVDTIDGNQNETLGSDFTVSIPSRVLPPRFLTASINNTQVTINWTHSVDGPPERYALFGTSDISLPMDRINEFDGISVDGAETSMTFNLPAGTYRFTVDAKIGTEFSDNFITLDITTPGSAAAAPKIINDINLTDIDVGQLQVFGRNVTTGRLNVRFLWAFGDSASAFRLYHDGGSGVVDFGSPIQFTRQSGLIQDFTTDQISFDNTDTLYKFVLRSVTADGVEDTNTFENEVILNGNTPPGGDVCLGIVC